MSKSYGSPFVVTLGQEKLVEFLDQCRDSKSARRENAKARVDIEKEDFQYLVDRRIDNVYKSSRVRKELKEVSSGALINPLRKIASEVCMAYQTPPARTLAIDDQDTNLRFTALLQQGKIGQEAKQWLRWAFISNVCVVVPTIRDLPMGPELRWEICLPHTIEVLPEPNDPEQIAIMGRLQSDGVVCVLDGQAWWYYGDDNELIDYIAHDIGVFPGTTFRVSNPLDSYFDPTRGNQLVNSTAELCRIYATLNWVRRDQDKKTFSIAAADLAKALPPGQQILPGEPVQVPIDAGLFKYEIHDFITSVDDFEKHLRLVYSEIVESYGLDSSMVDYNASMSNATNVIGQGAANQHARLKAIRESHTEYMRIAEKDLMWKTALIAQRFNHPLAVDPGIIRNSYQVDWGPLAMVDHPATKAAWQKSKIAMGAWSRVDVVRDDDPTLSREQALERIKRNINEDEQIYQLYRQFNMPMDPEEASRNVAQLQGSEGGKQRAENAEEEKEKEE